ncbi:phosphotransferase enzyme family protein [Sporormia fimetaria CBS 119925]|uniref:Phosphotransferase enzyme family protein n=1 Tax=Sporormia fimetaria CBS 119925 TaxID=1340428 RepID=A0A6A6VHB9_9PLEO|nr:phosphotransferase enzyme family protein [Sporormia fimetaria CBS 119925]
MDSNLYHVFYIATAADLPAALPTVAEIKSSSEILIKETGRKVVGVGEHYVVKYGTKIDLLEGHTMRFLQDSTKIPIPRVYALVQTRNSRSTKYIIMERIRGSTLESKWETMNHASKEVVASQLKAAFDEMRRLESPGGYCSLTRGGLPDGLFWKHAHDLLGGYFGPFKTETGVNKAIVARYILDGGSKHKAEYYTRSFEEVYQGHEPVFSHGDLSPKNIMIRDPPTECNGDTGQDGKVQEVVIIDWEFAGWYPSYWEYARAMYTCGGWLDDWGCWIDRMLVPWRNEGAWMTMFLAELYHAGRDRSRS